MSNGQRLAVASTLVMAASGAAFAAEPPAHILHHESIAITSWKTGAAQKTAGAEHVSFEAFGKRFELLLEPNERIHHPVEVIPLRGSIEGIPGSWARLTRGPSGHWQGMLFDGTEVYAIESANDIRSLAVQPLEKSSSAQVIYRLADLIVEWGPAFCEALPAGEKTTGLDAFQSLQKEVFPAKQMTVGVVGDYEFSKYFDPAYMTAEQAVVARMNIVDGIFSEQAGIKIEVPSIDLYDTPSDPFTRFDSKELLDEARKFRRESSEQLSRGVTHLMTGRDLNGDTVGVAFLGTVCGGEYAVGLSEGARSTTMAALIAAHEIGHNFNAPHDGEGACSAEGPTFLMAARLSGSNQFSACSLQQMQPKVETARCLRDYSPPDASVEVLTSSVQSTVNDSLAVQFNVRSTGGTSCEDVAVTAVVPSGLTLNTSSATGGTCTTGAGAVNCRFGALEEGAARTVTLNLTAQNAGTYPVDLNVSSSNDSVSSNNAGRVEVVITASAPNPGDTSNASSGGGGGGGGLGAGTLLALGALSLSRTLRRSKLI